MSLDDALRVIAARGRLMDGLGKGGMLAVPLADGALEPLLPVDVALAASATPHLSIVAGPAAGLAALAAALQKRGVLSRRPRVDRAFHTAAMAGIAEPLSEVLRSVRLNPPARPFVSGATGDWISVEEAVDPGFWVRHSLTPVRFSEALSTLFAAGHRLLLEVGPGNSLTSFALQHADPTGGKLTAIATMRNADDPQSDAGALLGAVARLWLSGYELEWQHIMVGYTTEKDGTLAGEVG
jgi:acyl transferase domain-containing protein